MAAVMLSPDDNVAIANSRIKAGEALPGGALASDDIEPGHKVALRPRANFFGYGDSEFVPWHVGATLDAADTNLGKNQCFVELIPY